MPTAKGLRLVPFQQDVRPAADAVLLLPLFTSDRCGKLVELESVGGRAHESQCIRFVWSGGGVAYRDLALALSRATPFATGIGGLKCYDIKGGIEKCSGADRPPPSVRHARLD